MNTISIENKTPRYFPFYKGKYLGKEPEGYSTKQGARKFMSNIPDTDVYKEYFGTEQEYKRTHYYFYKIDEKSREYESINPDKNNEFKTYDTRQRVYVKDLEFDLDEILESISKANIYSATRDVDAAVEFEKKYGLYPYAWVDDLDYKKAYTKYVNKYVEFREGVLEINVRWSDGTVTPAPKN